MAHGQSYVASVYHRKGQIFRYFGNAHHECVVGNQISCEDFQKVIVSRHKNGAVDEGMAAAATPAVNKTFHRACIFEQFCIVSALFKALRFCLHSVIWWQYV